jgi:hypothetical protein
MYCAFSQTEDRKIFGAKGKFLVHKGYLSCLGRRCRCRNGNASNIGEHAAWKLRVYTYFEDRNEYFFLGVVPWISRIFTLCTRIFRNRSRNEAPISLL